MSRPNIVHFSGKVKWHFDVVVEFQPCMVECKSPRNVSQSNLFKLSHFLIINLLKFLDFLTLLFNMAKKRKNSFPVKMLGI